MENKLTQFEAALSNPAFWEGDLYMVTTKAARDLDRQDWETLRKDWPNKGGEWWSRFLVSLSEVTDRGAVQFALNLLANFEQATAEKGISILQALAPAAGEYLGDEELTILAAAWRRHPDLRERIKFGAWEKGKSGQLRRLLGLDRWIE